MTNNIKFTKDNLNKISPPVKPEGKKGGVYDTYRDTKEKGLILMVSNGGAKTFYLYTKVNGRPERIKLGRFPDITVEQARKKAIENKGIIIAGKNPNREKNKIRSEITLEELFNEYMERYSKPNKTTWKQDEYDINRFLPHWFSRKISQIDKHDIQKLHDKIRNENGLYQANRLFERIRAIYNKAIEWGWDGENPTKGIKKFKEKSRERWLQSDELPHLWPAIAGEQNEIARDYILISILTGARQSNILAMQWAEINFARKEWRIPKTKNEDALTVPLVSQAIEVLRGRKKANPNIEYAKKEFVFPGTGDSGHLADPKKAWKRIKMTATIKLWAVDDELAALIDKVKSILSIDSSIYTVYEAIQKSADKSGVILPTGLMDAHIHDLRRTLGSWQVSTGASLAIVGKSLGHRSHEATAIYARMNIDPVRESVERATEAMFSQGVANND